MNRREFLAFGRVIPAGPLVGGAVAGCWIEEASEMVPIFNGVQTFDFSRLVLAEKLEQQLRDHYNELLATNIWG